MVYKLYSIIYTVFLITKILFDKFNITNEMFNDNAKRMEHINTEIKWIFMDCQMTDFEVGKIRPKIGFSENACMTKNLKLSSRNEWPDQENSAF